MKCRHRSTSWPILLTTSDTTQIPAIDSISRTVDGPNAWSWTYLATKKCSGVVLVVAAMKERWTDVHIHPCTARSRCEELWTRLLFYFGRCPNAIALHHRFCSDETAFLNGVALLEEWGTSVTPWHRLIDGNSRQLQLYGLCLRDFPFILVCDFKFSWVSSFGVVCLIWACTDENFPTKSIPLLVGILILYTTSVMIYLFIISIHVHFECLVIFITTNTILIKIVIIILTNTTHTNTLSWE